MFDISYLNEFDEKHVTVRYFANGKNFTTTGWAIIPFEYQRIWMYPNQEYDIGIDVIDFSHITHIEEVPK